MLLTLYNILIDIHWFFVLFLVFCLIFFVVASKLNIDSSRNLYKRQQEFEREFPHGIPFKKTTIGTRIKITLIMSFIYFMLIFTWLQGGLLVQTQCAIDRIEKNSSDIPKHIFVTYMAENKKYSEKAIKSDRSIYWYNQFKESSNQLCWYDRIDPSRVTLEPENIIGDFLNVIFSFVLFMMIMIIVQLGINRHNKMKEEDWRAWHDPSYRE